MKRMITTAVMTTVSALFLCGNAQGAAWIGGSGNWTSAGVDNWGLGTGDFPGDADTHTGDIADLSAAGTISIGSGDTITLTDNASQTFQTANATVNQTGGSMTISRSSVRVGNPWILSGTGSLTFGGGMQFFNGGSGASVNVSGGTFVGNAMQWRGNGNLSISGGSFTAAAVDLGFDPTGTGTIGVTGTGATTLQANSIDLAGGSGANSKTASFVFDGSGVDNWNLVGGGQVFTLDSSSFLTVNLGTFDASGGVPLFDYNNGGTGRNGTFDLANTTITGALGTFALGSGPLGLNPGEYFLEYDNAQGTGVGDAGSVVFFANSTVVPEPSSFLLLGLGALGLLRHARRRRRA